MGLSERSLHACPSEADLRHYHAKELSERDETAVREHLSTCAACAARAAKALAEHDDWIERIRSAGFPPQEAGDQSPRGEAGTTLPVISGYEILEEIRRGGQGIVFRALQKSTKREVALKLLREGRYASETARRRFEREVELAATLRHPHIVTIFDSGETPDGNAYFAMDYIRGERLDRHTAKSELALGDRLRLLGRICQAVNYAHQRGVIHRDLKPSNVLVDEAGDPHILDFGLARPVAEQDATVMTTAGQVAGTLPYMSPEQARGLPDAVDVRSDVYALGVMLYEQLTGTYPYPVEGDTIQVLKHIAETPPTPPSQPGRYSHPGPVDNELETVVLKALAKEPEERYQTAGELARDIDHYLAGEPIEAKRDSGLYLLKKTIYRHRIGVGVAAGFVLVVVAALVVSMTFWRQAATDRDSAQRAQTLAEQQSQEARRQAELARAAEARARRRFQQVRELADVFLFQLDPSIAPLPGSAPVRQFIVRKGLAYLDALATDAADDLNLQTHLAGAYITIGDVQGDLATSNLGDLHAALGCYQKALEMLERVAALDANKLPIHRLIMLDLLKIGDAHANLADIDAASQSFDEALALGEGLLAEHPRDRVVRDQLAAAHDRVSGYLQPRGDLEEALRHARESVRLREANRAQTPENPWLLQGLSASYARIGQIQLEQGRHDEALDSYRTCLAFAEEFVQAMPEHVYGRRGIGIAHQWIGIILTERGEHETAITSFHKALASIEGLLHDDPQNGLVQVDLAETCVALGRSQAAVGQCEAARSNFRRAIETADAALADTPQRADALQSKGEAYHQMARLDIARAEAEDCPAAERIRHWQVAREGLRRSLEVFADLRERGRLPPKDAGVPDEITAEIERCDAAINELTPTDSRPSAGATRSQPGD
jgi:tetratricopeptide (TPR) repeat protein/tRNA A-37 threonylcarbamoyl transferase component Bud32